MAFKDPSDVRGALKPKSIRAQSDLVRAMLPGESMAPQVHSWLRHPLRALLDNARAHPSPPKKTNGAAVTHPAPPVAFAADHFQRLSAHGPGKLHGAHRKHDFNGDGLNKRLPSGPHDAGNRVRNRKTGKLLFPIKRGTHLFDGKGHDRGVIDRRGVKINYGQRKRIRGRRYVYAFATHMWSPSGPMAASGWIRESRLKGHPLVRMPTIKAPRSPNGDGARYRITGGDPAKYGDLKVNPHVPRTKREAASDYLVRPGGMVTLLYNLPHKGGVSTDTLPVGGTFVRARGVKAVHIHLYPPDSGKRLERSLAFVYGRVGKRNGWIALDALQPKKRAKVAG
jgi:hypothetical protein